MKVTFLGGGLGPDGKGTIGGNMIEVSSNKSRVLLDFGIPIGQINRYFDVFERNKIYGSSAEKLATMNLFQAQYMRSLGKTGGANILLSHVHLDHYGTLRFVPALRETLGGSDSVRVYGTDEQHSLLYALLEIGKRPGVIGAYSPHSLDELSEWKISNFQVDHSIDASCGFLLEGRDGCVAYTGDFRFGKNRSVDDMARRIAGADILVTEATRTVNQGLVTEQDVMLSFEQICKAYGGLVAVIVGWYTYSKRIQTIIEASGGRIVVLDPAAAHILDSINGLNAPNVASKVRILDSGVRKTGWEARLYEDDPSRFISIEQVNSDRDNSVVVIPTSEKSLLARKTRGADPKESILTTDGDVAIASMSEPYDEESGELSRRIERYVSEILLVPLYYIHASGHAPLHQIAELVEVSRPKTVAVIHSEHPRILRNSLKTFNPDNVIIPRNGEGVIF